ncbi:MAG: ribonuclease Y [bacterium]|nr:ribonuclease Y [bacterium]
MDVMTYIIILVLTVSGFAGGWFLSLKIGKNKLQYSTDRANEIIESAKKETATLQKEKELELKDKWYRMKQDFDKETKQRKQELDRQEKAFINKENNIDRKADLINKKEKEVYAYERDLKEKDVNLMHMRQKLDDKLKEQNLQLEKVARLTQDEAKQILMDNLLDEAKVDIAKRVIELQEESKLTAKKNARDIIVSAIQRSAADHSVETTVSVVNLPSEEMKGRIIGREGRNIRAFELATGIQVVIDDTPEAVVLSGFDPMRREIAKMSLENLITDGRIHPGRIEESVDKAKKEMEDIITEAGQQALMDCGLNKVHSELVRTMGKLKFRTSYGQNVLTHSMEVSQLCGLMASELGLDSNMAKRAGFFHDIGKALDKSITGSHTEIGYDFAKKYNENPIVLNSIRAHHEDVEFTSPISVLVQAADAISGSRPGARRESLEGYVQRLIRLEEVASSFDGVTKTYAIQAGREVRVMVEPDNIDDSKSFVLAQDIAKKIETDMEYPGQVKVVVIRELRATEYAK